MPSEAFAERILRFVHAKGYRPQKLHELAEAMGIGEDEQGDFRTTCKALMKTGRIVLGSRSALLPPAPPGKVSGTFRANPRGFGFVIPDTQDLHADLYIPAGGTGGAITGDTVLARVSKRGKRDGKMLYEGRIVEILTRGQSRFVGELCRQLGRWFVVPDGNALHTPIVVGDPGAKDATPGNQVVVEITQYPSAGVEARGVIVKVLGKRGEPDVDTSSIIEQYQLPCEFGRETLEEVHRTTADFDPGKEAKTREDLRKLTVITIDPVDARDFDDAISLTKESGAAVELGIHIADVAHFVREGGALDVEARGRSNSVYLPRCVIPMLPETLSNGVCSLQERQPRLTKSVFITYDRSGRVKKVRVANSIIRSTKRLTYQQAGAILRGKGGRISANVVALVKDMERLAKVILRRRVRQGMLELDLPGIELIYDETGRVIDVEQQDTGFAHKIIEMFMVEANEAVARLFASKKVPALRRVHPEPRDLSSGGLRRFLKALGHELPAEADRFALQALLVSVRGREDSFPVNLAVLRSMQQAEYAPTRTGHFALASDDYCHFTSPIRRYPDLTIHRLLDMYLSGTFDKRGGKRHAPTEEDLASLGRQCSANERRAEAAERELKQVLVLRLLEKHVGEEFNGIVTGVANVGVFVQLERYLIDGLVRFDGLPDDWWELDATQGCVIGQRSGCKITVGDRLRVSISKIHIPTRRMDLALAEPLVGAAGSQRKTRAGGNGKTKRGAGTGRSTRSRGLPAKPRPARAKPATRKRARTAPRKRPKARR